MSNKNDSHVTRNPRENTENIKDETRAKRPPRVAMSDGGRSTLKFPGLKEDPNFVYRVVSDKEGRIDQFLAAYWEFVRKDEMDTNGNNRSVSWESIVDGYREQLGSVLCKTVGGSTIGYVMRLPRELYEQDQEEKSRKINARAAELEKEHAGSEDGNYGSVKFGN